MDNKVPSYIEKRIDVKAETVQVFTEAIKKIIEEEKSILPANTQVSLLTTLGQIHGEILNFTDNPESQDDLTQSLNEHFLQLKNFGLAILEEQHNKEITVVNNSALVVIADATLRPYSNPQATYNFKVLNLFADQIVGFSFGKIPED